MACHNPCTCLTKARLHRLQVSVAKIQQNLPELKRDGNTVLGAVTADQIYDSNSTQRSGAVLEQMEFIPKLAQQLQENPEQVVQKFDDIRSLSEY